MTDVHPGDKVTCPHGDSLVIGFHRMPGRALAVVVMKALSRTENGKMYQANSRGNLVLHAHWPDEVTKRA